MSVDGNFSQLAGNSKAKAWSMLAYNDYSPYLTDPDALVFFLNQCQPLIQEKETEELKLNTPVIITEKISTNLEYRAKMAEILFEQFEAPNVYFGKTPVLSAYGVGKTSALVLDTGALFSEIVCVQNGLVIPESLRHNSWSTTEISQLLSHHLIVQAKYFTSEKLFKEDETNVRKLRELHKCNDLFQNYLDFNYTVYGKQTQPKPEKIFSLPDGTEIRNVDLKRLSLNVLEKVFDQQHKGNKAIQVSVAESACAAPTSDIKKLMCNNVVCTGGIAGKTNFSSKLQDELKYLREGTFSGMLPEISVSTAHIEQLVGNDFNLNTLAWTGGSIIGSLSTFKDFSVSKKDFEEKGLVAFESKCL